MQRIGHQYRATVEFIPRRKSESAARRQWYLPHQFIREAVIMPHTDRRDFLKLAGLAGVAFTAGLFPGQRASAQAGDFHFVQFSDTHWGYSGAANPDAEHTLAKAVATVNGLAQPARPHRLHRRSHPHHRRSQAAPRAHEALPRDRLAPSPSRTCASCRASTTPRSTSGEAYQRVLRRDLLHLRPQGRALHRPRQRLRSRRQAGRRAARLARRRPQAAQARRSHHRADPPAVVRPAAAMGLDHGRRRQGDRAPDALSRTSWCSTATSTRSITT